MRRHHKDQFGQSAAHLGGRVITVRHPQGIDAESSKAVRLKEYLIILDDGHRVSVSIGGRGVPLVFLHGFGLSKRAYHPFLGRVAALGFRVIAVDAAAHGQTAALPAGDFRAAVDLASRALDVLGVRRAVVVGHSMGGRMALELAGAQPERVLAAVLLNAAAGEPFDRFMRQAFSSRLIFVKGAFDGMNDIARECLKCSTRQRRKYTASFVRAARHWSRDPRHLKATALAIADSRDSTEMLRDVREGGVPILIVHGADDVLVPWANAVSLATHSRGHLYKVRDAHHSWMIADPSAGAEVFATLLRAELGQTLDAARECFNRQTGGSTAWQDELLTPGGLAATLGGQLLEPPPPPTQQTA